MIANFSEPKYPSEHGLHVNYSTQMAMAVKEVEMDDGRMCGYSFSLGQRLRASNKVYMIEY